MSGTEKSTDPFEGKSYSLPDFSKIRLDRPSAGGGQFAQPDYLDYNIRGRDFFSRMSYNTGLAYLGGFALGSLIGIKQGLSQETSARGMRFKVNAVLNALSRRGGLWGNTCGVLALVYTGMDELTISSGADDLLHQFPVITPAVAGAATGMFYKSAAGVRVMALATVLGAVGASTMWGVSNFFNSSKFLKR